MQFQLLLLIKITIVKHGWLTILKNFNKYVFFLTTREI